LTGLTDIEIEIGNQGARLIAGLELGRRSFLRFRPTPPKKKVKGAGLTFHSVEIDPELSLVTTHVPIW
jgi:hypothetical protein